MKAFRWACGGKCRGLPARRVAVPPAGVLAARASIPFPTRTTIAAATALLLAACASTNFELSTESTPICTADDLAELRRVIDETQGVEAHDPVGFFIADFPARFQSEVNNWHPLSGYKETLCGALHHSNVHDGSGAEIGWNHFMIPRPPFRYLITDALPYKGGSGTWCQDDDWHSCGGTNDCMEGELTPGESFYENPWFAKSTGKSVLEGREICMYGPWVRECVHGQRPEIHPAELTWWSEKWHDADLYWLMAARDDSDRFDTEDDFDIEGSIPAGWRPWGGAPMTGRFRIAFQANPSGPVLNFEIGEAFASNVVTGLDAQARLDADDGPMHAIAYDGRIVLRANENQPRDDDLGVTFTGICRQPGGTLQGYVTITTMIAKNNSAEEGYHVLFVTADEQRRPVPPVVVPDLKAKALVTTKGHGDSMRVKAVEGRPRLLGDLEVGVISLEGASSEDIGIERVELRTVYGQQKLQFDPNRSGPGGFLKGLPLLDSARLAFIMRSGAVVEVAWPGLAVAAMVDESVLEAADAPPSAWQAIVKAADGDATDIASPLPVKQAREVRLRAVKKYALLKDGRPSLEEGSPFVEHLNNVLDEGGDEEMKRLFGTAEPVRVTWSISALNLATGETVATESASAPASAGGGEVVRHAVDASRGAAGDAVLIRFPDAPPGVIYEVQATATVTDTFGTTHEVAHRLWSHYLSDGSRHRMADALLPAVGAVAGIPGEVLLDPGRRRVLRPGDPMLRDTGHRRARMTAIFAVQAGEDGRITVDELSGLVQAARLAGAR